MILIPKRKGKKKSEIGQFCCKMPTFERNIVGINCANFLQAWAV